MKKRTESQIHLAALQWSLSGDTGISSEAMCAAVFGLRPNPDHGSHWPRDAGDLGRCVRFLRAVPEARRRLGRVAKLNPTWARLIARWAELEGLYCAEEDQGPFTKTYALLESIIEPRRRRRVA